MQCQDAQGACRKVNVVMKWIIENTDDLARVAAEFLEYADGRRLFALRGGMGVGKTTFVKAVAKCLGTEDEVNSPTFAIVNEYIAGNGDSIYHFDFYRLKQPSEALDFGCEEYFESGCMCFMEWPELIEEFLPEDVTECFFKELPDGRRELEVVLSN